MKLLELRNMMKKKKPVFLRQEVFRRKKLEAKWRMPKGHHSKMKQKLSGRRKMPSIGYSSPGEVRGLTREGYRRVLVHNLAELKKVKENAVELSRTLGSRKKLELLKKIKELKLKVINVKNIDAEIKAIEEKVSARKAKAKEKEKAKASVKAKVKKVEKKEEKISKEEKEKKEKEEKKKTLEQIK